MLNNTIDNSNIFLHIFFTIMAENNDSDIDGSGSGELTRKKSCLTSLYTYQGWKGNQVQCHICWAVLVYKTTTSNMLKHSFCVIFGAVRLIENSNRIEYLLLFDSFVIIRKISNMIVYHIIKINHYICIYFDSYITIKSWISILREASTKES